MQKLLGKHHPRLDGNLVRFLALMGLLALERVAVLHPIPIAMKVHYWIPLSCREPVPHDKERSTDGNLFVESCHR
jgi:hypothetical protein